MNINVDSFSISGRRNYNEDTISISQIDNYYMFSLFDGHGGNFVSKYLKKKFHKLLIKHNKNDKNICDIYQDTINDIQNIFKSKYIEETKDCGSTMISCIVDYLNNKVHFFNLGDSRILCIDNNNNIKYVSQDHKPESKIEKERLEKENHKIVYDSEDEVYRVDGYSVSRSIGDCNYKSIIQVVDCTSMNIKDIKKIILACDGIWDVLSNKKIVDLLRSTSKAYEIVNYAYLKESTDNLSVIIIEF